MEVTYERVNVLMSIMGKLGVKRTLLLAVTGRQSPLPEVVNVKVTTPAALSAEDGE